MPENNNKKSDGTNVSKRNVIIAVAGVLVVAAVVVLILMMGGKNKIGDITVGAAYDYEEKGYLKLGDYKGIELSVEVTDDDVKEGITDALDSVEAYEHVDGTPVNSDTVDIDYTATLDGQALEDYSAQDEIFEVGSEDNFAEFNEAIVTMSTGETKTVEVKFEDDYGDETVDGKTVSYELTLNYICGEPITQELTDEFASEYSEGECTSADGFEDYIRKTLYQENVDSIADDVWTKVVENADIKEVVEGEQEKAVKETMDNYESFAELSGCTVDELLESFGMTREDAEDVGKDMAEERMIAKTIAAKENIVLDDAAYQKLLTDTLSEDDEEAATMTLEQLESSYTEQYAENPREAMFLECVKKYVADNAKITGLQ